MRKLLTCTTALSVALSTAPTFPAHAQSLAEDGSVLGPDGSVLCVPTPEAPCDLEAITQALRDAEAAAAEAEAAAAAAEEEAARAAAEAEAARMAAEEEAARAAAAAEEEAARAAAEAEAARVAAEEEAAAAAEEEAARMAAEEEAARAAAAAEEEAARAAAEAEAARVAAEEEAAAAAEAETAPAEEPAAEAAEEPAAPAAEAEVEAEVAPAEEPAAEEPAPEAVTGEAEPAPDATEEAAAEPAGEPAAEATEEPAAPAEESAVEAEIEAGAEAEAGAAPAEDTAAAEEPADPAADPAGELATAPEAAAEAEPVDAPVVSEEAAVTLESILAAPTVTEEAATAEAEGEAAVTAEGEAAAEPAPPAVPEAAAAVLSTSGAAAAEETEAPAAADPVAVVSEVITEGMTRSSDEEFAAAPVAVAEGKKSGLSDLEKVGLVALGALVVGAVINQANDKEAKTVVSNSGDRVVVQNPDGSYTVYKDDDAVLRRPGVETTTETYRDGSTRTVVKREDGTQVVTIRDASGRVLRRATYDRNGNEAILIDDLYPEERIDITKLPPPRPDRVTISTSDGDAALKAELAALEAAELGRKFSLRQIREIREVRSLAATIEVDSITFDTGSAAIKATEARKLADIGRLMQELLAANPREVFLIEGHTDAVGSAASNLSLSDRRAESMALALTEYFDIPPENLVVQGYGESELKVPSAGDERANRRVVVRLVTPLMRTAELR